MNRACISIWDLMHRWVFVDGDFFYLYLSLSIYLEYSTLSELGIHTNSGIHHIVVNDWERGVDADQNVVPILVSSVLTPNLAPSGKMYYMLMFKEPNN